MSADARASSSGHRGACCSSSLGPIPRGQVIEDMQPLVGWRHSSFERRKVEMRNDGPFCLAMAKQSPPTQGFGPGRDTEDSQSCGNAALYTYCLPIVVLAEARDQLADLTGIVPCALLREVCQPLGEKAFAHIGRYNL